MEGSSKAPTDPLLQGESEESMDHPSEERKLSQQDDCVKQVIPRLEPQDASWLDAEVKTIYKPFDINNYLGFISG